MTLLYKMAVVGQTWLTAAMTLVAGMPHFSCACADGNVKPVCVKLSASSSGCCCAGTCCAKAGQPGEQLKPRSCCSRGSPTSTAPRIAISRTCCTRTFAQPQAPVLSHGRAPVLRDYVAGEFLTSSTLDPNSCQDSSYGSNAWQSRAVSPPTDFLALFRHYVI